MQEISTRQTLKKRKRHRQSTKHPPMIESDTNNSLVTLSPFSSYDLVTELLFALLAEDKLSLFDEHTL